MAYVRKEIYVEVKIGDEVDAPYTDYELGTTLYVCYLGDDKIYIHSNKNAPKEECEIHGPDECSLI